MGSITELLANNAAWAARCREDNPNFFQDLAAVHKPRYLWIGCSDARVPANTLLGVRPGEVFVHRNIANQVSPSDGSGLAVIQYAVETLQVSDIIVCGHDGCGGIQVALGIAKVGSTVDTWLQPIKELSLRYQEELAAIKDPVRRTSRLAELNVRQQVLNVCQASSVQQAWQAGRALAVHGLVYAIEDGLLKGLDLRISGMDDLAAI